MCGPARVTRAAERGGDINDGPRYGSTININPCDRSGGAGGCCVEGAQGTPHRLLLVDGMRVSDSASGGHEARPRRASPRPHRRRAPSQEAARRRLEGRRRGEPPPAPSAAAPGAPRLQMAPPLCERLEAERLDRQCLSPTTPRRSATCRGLAAGIVHGLPLGLGEDGARLCGWPGLCRYSARVAQPEAVVGSFEARPKAHVAGGEHQPTAS